MSYSIHFFETQFRQQVAGGAVPLNPFEALALPHLRGRVLDFGCGLGNLAVAAAQAGCEVLALDASPTAIHHLNQRARQENLPITAGEADLRDYRIAGEFDAAVAIGLLMFFDCATALRQLAQLQACVKPGGVAVINVLVEGTTFLGMFDPGGHCLLRRGELRERFAGWTILAEQHDRFPVHEGKWKVFDTLVARKAAQKSAPA